MPSTSGVSESAACPLSPMADYPSAPSPTCSLLQSVTLLACSLDACVPAVVLGAVLLEVLHWKIKNVFFVFLWFFMLLFV